jgi:hypothetical protein
MVCSENAGVGSLSSVCRPGPRLAGPYRNNAFDVAAETAGLNGNITA